MGKSLSRLFLIALVSAPAFAAPAALVTKTNGSGHVHPDYYRSEKCEVFADRVVITRAYGMGVNGLKTVETLNVSVAGDLKQVIANATAANVAEKENMLCDGPSTTISTGNTLLYSTGGCGTPRKEREGAAARALRSLVDAHCPVTHDFSQP